MAKILLVDDDPLILNGIGSSLDREGYTVVTAEKAERAVALLRQEHFDLVLTDLVMENMNGVDLLDQAKDIDPELMVIILTGYGTLETAIKALRLKADDYLLKPCEAEEISFRVRRCLEDQALRRRVKIYENFLPVCCVCKKIRDDTGKTPGQGQWLDLEVFIRTRAGLEVTSSYCPDCAEQVKKQLSDL